MAGVAVDSEISVLYKVIND